MIEKTMTIEQILRTDAGLADILLSSGMHCLGCVMASGENLEQACAVHGIDAYNKNTALRREPRSPSAHRVLLQPFQRYKKRSHR